MPTEEFFCHLHPLFILTNTASQRECHQTGARQLVSMEKCPQQCSSKCKCSNTVMDILAIGCHWQDCTYNDSATDENSNEEYIMMSDENKNSNDGDHSDDAADDQNDNYDNDADNDDDDVDDAADADEFAVRRTVAALRQLMAALICS